MGEFQLIDYCDRFVEISDRSCLIALDQFAKGNQAAAAAAITKGNQAIALCRSLLQIESSRISSDQIWAINRPLNRIAAEIGQISALNQSGLILSKDQSR